MASKVASVEFKAQRGTKRTCQNADCGARFYDLNRDPITCPICNSVYVIQAQPVLETPVRAVVKTPKRPAIVPDDVKPNNGAEDEVLVAEGAEEEAAPGDDDTFLEEVEEESPDVTTIVDAPIEPDEKS
jgi:uncharacterized protein (TIGR02300 family)